MSASQPQSLTGLLPDRATDRALAEHEAGGAFQHLDAVHEKRIDRA